MPVGGVARVPRVRRVSAVAAIVLATGLALTGCAGDSYPRATASRLQHAVLEVATSASTHDYATALTRLDALERATDTAAERGSITTARHDAITRSIAAIRVDLTALQAAAEKAALQEQLQQLQQQQNDDKKHGPGPQKGPKGGDG